MGMSYKICVAWPEIELTVNSYQSSVTFSGFLNALDGVASGEERIIFMTTNHVEKLDPALIRPGRVDLNQLIDDATPEQASVLFKRFYGGRIVSEDISDAEVVQYADRLHNMAQEEMLNGRRVSMAALQGFFIRNDARTAIDNCRELFVSRIPTP